MAPKTKGSKKRAPQKAADEGGKAPVKTSEQKKSKALKAKKAVVKGQFSHRKRKIRTAVQFRRPKTLSLPRHPMYPRKSVPKRN